MENALIQVPDKDAELEPLHVLVNVIRGGLDRCERGRRDWVEGAIQVITGTYGARQHFKSDHEFGEWWDDSGLGNYLNKDDRAALVQMGAHFDATREALEITNRRSLRLIWSEEIAPRVLSPAKPPEPVNNAAKLPEPDNTSWKKPPDERWKHQFAKCVIQLHQLVADGHISDADCAELCTWAIQELHAAMPPTQGNA